MFTGLFILFIEATTTTSPWVTLPLSSPLFRRPRAARRASLAARNFTHRSELYASLYASPVTLRTTDAKSENIATLEVKYRTSRTNFTHRMA